MTLGDIKQEVFRLIEEIDTNSTDLTKDPDFKNKINTAVDIVQRELARIRKIPVVEELEVEKGEEINLKEEFPNFYQLESIKKVDYDIFGSIVEFNENGTAKIYYYKYPKKITKDSADNTKLEIDDAALNVMPMGVAADILKSDVSNQYGRVYAERYAELKQGLDPRYSTSSCSIDGGIEI